MTLSLGFYTTLSLLGAVVVGPDSQVLYARTVSSGDFATTTTTTTSLYTNVYIYITLDSA
jgi:hypothetical protein